MPLQPPGAPPLRTKEDIFHYLDFVLDQGDPKALTAALADIAKAARKLPLRPLRTTPRCPRAGRHLQPARITSRRMHMRSCGTAFILSTGRCCQHNATIIIFPSVASIFTFLTYVTGLFELKSV
jgi:hypothetical protein